MIQTYQGYIQDGRFIPVGNSLEKIPEKRRSILNVLTDEVVEGNDNIIHGQLEPPEESPTFKVRPKQLEIPEENLRSQKVSAIKKILADAAAINDVDNVLTDSDWDEMENLRSQTSLARTVEL